MRTFILMMAIIYCAGSPVYSQSSPDDRKDMMVERMGHMADSLNLDSLQKLLFINAYDQYFTQRFKLREKYSGDREKMRDANHKLTESREASLKSFLSEDQWRRYEAMIKNMMDRRSRRRGRNSN